MGLFVRAVDAMKDDFHGPLVGLFDTSTYYAAMNLLRDIEWTDRQVAKKLEGGDE